MKLDVPYISQKPFEDDLKNRRWCGLACIWMVLSHYLKDKAPSMGELLETYGQDIEKNGFSHKDFLKIARDFGLKGFRKSWWIEPGVTPLLEKFREEGESVEEIQRWIQTNTDEGIFTIKHLIDQNTPVIVSVSKDFSSSKTTHLVVLKGYDESYLVINDPLTHGEDYQIEIEEFNKYWLKQAIIIQND